MSELYLNEADDCIMSQLLSEGPTYNESALLEGIGSCLKSKITIGTFLSFSLWLVPTIRPSLQLLPKEELVLTTSTMTVMITI